MGNGRQARLDHQQAGMGSARAGLDHERCGDHAARITALEKWITRIDGRMWAVLIGIAATFGTSLISIAMIYFKKV